MSTAQFTLEGVFEGTRAAWPALRVAQDLFRAAELWELRAAQTQVLGVEGTCVPCAPADGLRVVVQSTVVRMVRERAVCGIGGCGLPDERTRFRVSKWSMRVADGADAAATASQVPTVVFAPGETGCPGRITSGTLTGTVRILALVEAFNHASCQCYFEDRDDGEARFLKRAHHCLAEHDIQGHQHRQANHLHRPAVVVVGEKGRGAGCWARGTTQIEAAMQMTSCLLFKALGICGGDDRMRLDIMPVVLPLQALKEKLRSSQLQFVIRVSDEHSVLSALQAGKLAPTCMIADGEFLLTAALERRWQTVVDCILTDFAAVIEGSYSGSCGGSKACTQALCCLRGTIAWCLAANVLPEPYLVARMLGLCAVSPEIVQQLLRQAAATPGPCALKVVIFQQFQTPQLTLRAQESSCVVEAEAVEAAKAESAVTSLTRTP
jgi:hypothetical protein